METLFLEFTIRAALLVAATAAILHLLSRKDAAAQHRVWSGVVFAMLLLPVWTVWGPKLTVGVLPRLAERVPVSAPATVPGASAKFSQIEIATPNTATNFHRWTWGNVIFGFYLLGAAFLLARLAVGFLYARRLVSAAILREGRLTSRACATPVTAGWLRPRVVLPESWPAWPPAKLDAVLAHEGEHARRRDPLFQGLALLNRALFWFHPAAWWLERHISLLAEEACDDAVLLRGISAGEYADYLMDMARAVASSGGRINIAGAAMPGNSLSRRIKRIVEDHAVVHLSAKRALLVAFACAGTCTVLAAAQIARVQPGATMQSLQQTAGTVAPNAPEADSLSVRYGSSPLPGENIVWKDQTAGLLLVSGYELPESQFVGLPSWADSEHFNVISASAVKPNAEETKTLTQALLAKRFKLAVHPETRDLPYYELLQAAPGKFGPNIRANLTPCDPSAPMGTPTFRACGSISLRRMKSTLIYEADGITVQQFVSALAGLGSNEKLDPSGYNRNIDRPIVDHSGLADKFDLTLEFAPEWPGSDKVSGSAAPPSLSKALEDQLGLELVPRTGPVQVMVVDRMELPATSPVGQGRGGEVGPKFVLSDLKIEGDVRDRDGVRNRILKEWKDRQYGDAKELAAQVTEVGIRADFQKRGYFKVLVHDPVQQPLGLADGKQRILVVAAVTEGDQFRLGTLTIQNVVQDRPLSISPTDLRDQFHLRNGDLFNVTEIRAGLEGLQRLYETRGYADMKAEPDTEVDTASHRIDLIIRITERSQPVVAAIAFDGNRRIPSEELASRIFIRPGDRFSDEGIQHDLKALENLGVFDDVRLEVQDSRKRPDGRIVIFHLKERPVITIQEEPSGPTP